MVFATIQTVNNCICNFFFLESGKAATLKMLMIMQVIFIHIFCFIEASRYRFDLCLEASCEHTQVSCTMTDYC